MSEQKRQMSKLETELSEPEVGGVNEESAEKTFQVGERGVKNSGERGVIVEEKCQSWRDKCQRVKRGVKREKEVSMSWMREGSKQEREKERGVQAVERGIKRGGGVKGKKEVSKSQESEVSK